MARRGRPPRPGGRPGGRKRRPPRARAVPAGPQVPDTPEGRLEEETRKAVGEIVAARKADRGLSESERLLSRVMDQHPEYSSVFAGWSEFVVTGSLDSPFLHVALHRIVEQRVVTRELRDEMSRLTAAMSWHEAVHETAEQVSAEMFGTRAEDEEASASA